MLGSCVAGHRPPGAALGGRQPERWKPSWTMEAAEESGSYSGCLACCWIPACLLLALLACCFLRLWQGHFQVLLPTRRDPPQASSQGHQEGAPGARQEGDSPRSQRRRSIRRLLCDNPACVVCEQAAAEASDLAYPRELGLGQRPPTRGPPLVPRACRKGCSSALPTWGPWLRSVSEPPSACGPGLLTSGKRGCRCHRSPAAGFCSEAACGSSSSSARSREGSHRSTSSLAGGSFSPRTEGSGGSSSSSFGSQQSSFHWWSLTLESRRVSASGRKSVSVSEAKGKSSRRRRGREIGHGTAHHRGKGKPQREPTTPQTLPLKSLGVETPFLGAEALGGLEWHLLRKRFQHALGLPSALLRSLRAFMPPAPDTADRKPLRMTALLAPRVQVQPQPQPLPFLEPLGCRAELERHLKRRVTLRHWGLLQRVQGPLQAMQPGGVPPAPQARQQPKRRHLEPPRGAELACPAQPFQVAGPNGSTARKMPVPPGLLTGRRLTSTDLKTLESHVLKKRLEHQWGLPGLVSCSLKQFLPAAPGPTASHTSLQPSLAAHQEDIQTVCGQLPFVQPETKRDLERHVRRLRVRRQWGLPKRVAASLPGSMLVPSASAGKPVWSSPSPRRPQGERPPLGSRPASLQVGFPGGPPAVGSHGDPKGQALQRHLAKKAVEIHLGVFPRMVCCSCTPHSWAGRPALPQVILPGQGAVELRRKDLPFVEQAALSCIELNIAHKRLAYQWGLPTQYTKSLARLCPTVVPATATLSSPTGRPTPWVTFAATETRFMASEAREQLEWHMKKQQMQHLWGLPGLVQRSLCRLLPEAPRLGQQGRGQVEAVATPWGRPSFLSKETWERLEANVWKRVILQRWGLPRMVLHSLRMLFPERRGLPSPGGRERTRRTRRAIRLEGRLPHRPAGRRADPLLGHKDAREMEHHLTKKSVEMYLEALPQMARISWQLTQRLAAGQPLPRPIGPGQGTQCPRSRFLPFLRGEDLERVELAIRRQHLFFLWGLGPCQVGVLEAMRAPVPSTPARRPRAARRIEFSAVPAPFLAQRGREVLDLHLRRKRMQHQWGLPLFLQRSLRAFTQAPPPLPPTSRKAKVEVHVVQRDFLSLPESTRTLLEAHVQKRKLHRHWRLPRRVLGPLKRMSPKARGPVGSPKMVLTHSHPTALPDPGHGGSLGPGGPVARGPGGQGAPRWPATPPPPAQSLVAAQALEEIRHCLAQKYVEEQLGTFPALVQQSRRDASLRGKEPLPKLIPPGRGTPQARCCLLAFHRREDVERIALAVRHVHLVSLYRGARHEEARPRPSSAPLAKPRKGEAWAFTGVKLPFLQEGAKAALEEHVKKKRLRHMWCLLVTVQKSLWCLMHQPPSSINLRQKRSALLTVCIQRREPPVFPPPVRQGLERHVQKMKARRLWGLPCRILQSLNVFTPSRKKKPESKATSSHGRPGRPRSKERGGGCCRSGSQPRGPVQAPAAAGTAPADPVAERRVVRQHQKGARGKQKK